MEQRASWAAADQPHFVFYHEKRLSEKEREEVSQEVSKMRERLRRPRGIIMPDSKFMRYWDAANMLFLSYTAIVTPFEVALIDSLRVNTLFVINRLVDFYFLTDCFCVQFNLAFKVENKRGIGTTVLDRKHIIQNYISSWFFWDFLSLIPFDMIGMFTGSSSVTKLKVLRIIRLLRLIKLLRVLRASVIVQRWERRISLSYSTMSLIKFACLTLIMGHWMACIWSMTGKMQEPQPCWLQTLQDTDDDGSVSHDERYHTFDIYSAALYWAVVTITSVGYGDISATNPTEHRVAIFCVLVCSWVWAYIIGSACGIIATLDLATIQHHQQMDHLNFFIRDHQFSANDNDKLREFFHHTKEMNRNSSYRDLILRMSPTLQRFVTEQYCEWISRVPYLADATMKFVIALINHPSTYHRLFSPREVVDDPSQLMIVVRGVGSCRGRVLLAGAVWNTDFILLGQWPTVARPERFAALMTHQDTATALTFLEILAIPANCIVDLCNVHEHERKQVSKAFYRLAFLKYIIHYANYIQGSYGIPKDGNGLHRAFQAVNVPCFDPSRCALCCAARDRAAGILPQRAEAVEDDDLEGKSSPEAASKGLATGTTRLSVVAEEQPSPGAEEGGDKAMPAEESVGAGADRTTPTTANTGKNTAAEMESPLASAASTIFAVPVPEHEASSKLQGSEFLAAAAVASVKPEGPLKRAQPHSPESVRNPIAPATPVHHTSTPELVRRMDRIESYLAGILDRLPAPASSQISLAADKNSPLLWAPLPTVSQPADRDNGTAAESGMKILQVPSGL